MSARRALLFALAFIPALSHAFDWRSLLHGEPELPPKAPPAKTLATVSTAAGAARDPEVEAFMRALAEALKTREAKPMVARLADAYTIDAMPAGSKAPELFVIAVERIPAPSEIVIQGVEAAGATRTATAEFRYGSAPPKTRTFRFDRAGRLLRSDLFAVSTRRHGN
jgi:hypothetical protein